MAATIEARAMYDDLRTTLRSLAKTAMLCGLLGLILYGAVVLLSQSPSAGQVAGLVLAAPAAVMLALLVLDALRRREFPLRGPVLRRDGSPVAYWFSIAWFGACAGAMALIALWCAWVVLAAGG